MKCKPLHINKKRINTLSKKKMNSWWFWREKTKQYETVTIISCWLFKAPLQLHQTDRLSSFLYCQHRTVKKYKNTIKINKIIGQIYIVEFCLACRDHNKSILNREHTHEREWWDIYSGLPIDWLDSSAVKSNQRRHALKVGHGLNGLLVDDQRALSLAPEKK